MRLYEGSIQTFKEDVLQNRIADKIAAKYQEYYKKRVNPSEHSSWNISLRFIKDVLEYSGIVDNYIAIEYELPYSEKRIDVLLFGKNKKGEDNIILIELKQWSNENVKDCENDGNVLVNYGKFRKEQAHPSRQAEGYYYLLKDFMSIFDEEKNIFLGACVYCHNYSKGNEEILYLPKFKEAIKEYPLFSKEEFKELGDYLGEKLKSGGGLEVFNRFAFSTIRPSKRLLDHTKEMINKQQIFNLIDDQISAYNAIMSQAKKLSKTKEKSVIIVKGGPGTGKSVIALEVMGRLLRSGKKVFHATGSSAFTKTLRKILGTRSQHLFKFFFNFTKSEEDEIDILICDEAHRIRKDSDDWGVPWKLKSKNPQIDDLIKPSRLSIFFIDEHQVVRPSETGNVGLIKQSAEKFGAKVFEFELQTQFRCGGSDSYLQWVENVLKIEESEWQTLTEKEGMEFKIINDPNELRKLIEEKNKEKPNSSRIVAGFCWPWSQPNHDGTLVNDVKIGGFEMPWEKKDEFWRWATENSGMEQVGTVYTAQGFEFDYIGVIFGNDLVYDMKKEEWIAKPENSQDNALKRNNENMVKHLKNVYRVLLSRAHKGVYVYFIDRDTENYFRSKIEGDVLNK